MNFEQPIKEISPKEMEIKEKRLEGFKKSYDMAVRFREFARGWGEYENEKELSFSVLISKITDRCQNASIRAIESGEQIDSKIVDQEILKIDEATERIVRFEEKTERNILGLLRSHLDSLKKALSAGDLTKILQASSKLESYYNGFMKADDVLLSPADKAVE